MSLGNFAFSHLKAYLKHETSWSHYTNITEYTLITSTGNIAIICVNDSYYFLRNRHDSITGQIVVYSFVHYFLSCSECWSHFIFYSCRGDQWGSAICILYIFIQRTSDVVIACNNSYRKPPTLCMAQERLSKDQMSPKYML